MNDPKRTTIKDIAEIAGVSIGSVHLALYDKIGVSDETRAHIKSVASELGYKPNTAAASLKRKTLWVAASFPGPNANSRHYYKFIWDGIVDWFKIKRDLNVELIQLPYYSGSTSHANVLQRLLAERTVDGLLTTGETDYDALAAIKRFSSNNIPVILVSTDATETERLCCIQPDYNIIGHMMAELITNQISPEGNILLCAGIKNNPSHYLIANGFDAYIAENNIYNTVYKCHPEGVDDTALKRLKTEILSTPNLKACAAVNAQGSLLLGKALSDLALPNIMSVGNDMFNENLNSLKSSVFTNLINKRPYTQAYTAARYMTEYLISCQIPPSNNIYIGSEVVFKSSLMMYTNKFTGQML